MSNLTKNEKNFLDLEIQSDNDGQYIWNTEVGRDRRKSLIEKNIFKDIKTMKSVMGSLVKKDYLFCIIEEDCMGDAVFEITEKAQSYFKGGNDE